MRFYTPVTGTFKKLLDVIVESCSVQKQNINYNTETNIIIGLVCNNTTANTITNNISNDPAMAGSFFLHHLLKLPL